MFIARKIVLLSAIALMTASSGGLVAKETDLTNAVTPVPVVTVEGMTEYRLPNGLRVVLYPDMSKPTATVNMTYLVGSRHENYGETGMAHLLEHLMFKGSKNYPNPTAEFTKRGFRMNGSTWLDRTNYYVSFTANDDNMKWALGWQADAMINSFIAQKDLDTEMTVVRNEYEMGENRPVSVLMKRMQSVLFDWHSYGRSTIGARSDIENVEIANLQAFYHRYYQPDNAVLTVTGKFDRDQVLAWIGEFFGPIAKPERALPKEWTVEPTADGEREFTVRRPGESQVIMVGYRLPAALHPDWEPAAIATQILADAPTGRLYKELVETGLATQVFGWTIPGQHPGFVLFGAQVNKDEALGPVRDKLVEVIEHAFEAEPATEQELSRQKADQATMFDRQLSDPEAFGVGLSDYIALGDWRIFFTDRDAIQKVKVSEVNDAAKKYFVRDNRVVGMYIPTDKTERAEVTPAPSVEDYLKGFKFRQEGRTAEAFDSSQDNINARTSFVEAGGVKIALLPKKNLGETVVVQMKFQNGNVKTGANAAINMLSTAMMSRGTSTMTRDEIDDAFTALRMEGSPFAFTTDREHLAGAIGLAGSILTDAAFPAKEFETLKQQTLVGLRAKSDDPGVKARDVMTKHFNTYPKGDARYTETSEELIAEVEKLTLDDVRNYWKNVFGTGRGYIAVVGDFDPEVVAKDLRMSIIGRKTSNVVFERVVSDYRPVEAGRFVVDTPEKENGTLMARVDFPANVKDADVPALIAADWILGGSSGLSNRIVTRLRQKEGLSYGAGSGITLPEWGNRARWSVGAIVAPQNIKQAEASLRDELKRAMKEGITEQELAEAKRGIIESRAVNRAQDATLAGAWLNLMDAGRDWSFSKAMEEAIEKLTVADVNAAIRRIADPDKLTYVLAGDLAKARDAGKDFSER